MFVKYYADLRRKLIWGGIYLSSLLVMLWMVYFQTGKPFSVPVFFTFFFWTFAVAFCLYQFLKTLLSPLVVVLNEQVIISGTKRKTVPRGDISRLEITQNMIHITYLENGISKSVNIPVARKAVRERHED